MSEYAFVKNLTLFNAFEKYMTTNDAPLFNGFEITGNNLIIKTSDILSEEQINTLTNLVIDYVEPPYDLNFDHTESLALYSLYTNDANLVQVNDRSIVQTLIFTNRNNEGSGNVLDCVKTVLEYNTPNVQNFLNVTTGSIEFEIYDITRNYQILLDTIDISSIVSDWNALAETGSTSGNNTVFKSHMCCGLMDKTTDYDCIYQFRIKTSNPDFYVRMNGLQWIFYNKTFSTL